MKIMAKAKWVDAKGQYSTGRVLMMGPVKVGAAGYDGCVSKNNPLTYFANFYLPGISVQSPHFVTQKEAENYVWETVKKWFKATLGEKDER